MTNRTLYLHIGATKTGTSALQSGLAANADALAAQGVAIPPGKRDDKAADGRVTGGNSHEMIFFARKFEEMPDQAAARLRDYFARATAESDAHSFVISGEAIPGTHEPAQMQRLKDLTEEFFTQVRVIFYVRHIADHALSQYGEFLKRRQMRLGFAQFAPTYEALYKDYIERFENVFGPDVMMLRLYDADRAALWPNFVRLLGVDPDATVSPTMVNRSLTASEMEMIRRINDAGCDRMVVAKAVEHFLRTTPGAGGSYVCSPKTIDLLREKNQEIIDFVNARIDPATPLKASSDALAEKAKTGPNHDDTPAEVTSETFEGMLMATMEAAKEINENYRKQKVQSQAARARNRKRRERSAGAGSEAQDAALADDLSPVESDT